MPSLEPSAVETHAVSGAIIGQFLPILFGVPEIVQAVKTPFNDCLGQGKLSAPADLNRRKALQAAVCEQAMHIAKEESSSKGEPGFNSGRFVCDVFALAWTVSSMQECGAQVPETFKLALNETNKAVSCNAPALGAATIPCKHILMMAMKHRIMDVTEAVRISERGGLSVVR